MVIKDLTSLKEFFRQNVKTPIFGIGVYAFDRLGLEEIVPDYRILALRHSLDTELIEKDIKVLSLEKGMGTKHINEPRNSTTILKLEKTKKYLSKFKNPPLLVYKPSLKMEQVCQENNWHLIANPSSFGKELFENKIKFRKILQEIGIATPPGKITPVDKLHYGHLMNKYGLPFVIQHPTKGGGKGTFFIKSLDDFENAVRKLKGKWDEDEEKEITPPGEVIVAQFIQGPSPSATGCVTRQGVLAAHPQYQIIDSPLLYNSDKGNGLFCGHDWTSSSFSEKVLKQIYQSTKKIGQYFQQKNYRGIFGLDFIMDKKTNEVYVVECNPRLLATLPAFNMSQLLNDEVSLLACHVLEFLDIDYQMDIAAVNKSIQRERIGSQMFLHNLTGRWSKNHKQVKAGIYKLKQDRIKYLRPGYDLKHLKGKEEFLLADGVPFKKSHFSPNRRLCRILSLAPVLDVSNQLNSWASQTAQSVYRAFEVKPVRFIKIKKFFFPNFLAKG